MDMFRRAIVVSALAIEMAIVTVTVASADYFFSDSELAEFYASSGGNACREICEFGPRDRGETTGGYRMVRLEVLPFSDSRQVYLVRRIGECGSAGCESAVLLREAGRMVRIEDRFGLDTDRAERIARNALGIVNRGGTAPSPSHLNVAVAVLCLAALCAVSAITTRRLAAGLSVWKRIVLLSTTSVVSSGGLYLLGVTDEVKLLAWPLIAGVTVTVIVSIRDTLS